MSNGGMINTESIYNTHRQVKKIVSSYSSLNKEAADITETILDDWVGYGRNEFETQYSLLMSKIEDFGDVLYEIYDALVEAEAEYEELDDETRQSFVQAMS